MSVRIFFGLKYRLFFSISFIVLGLGIGVWFIIRGIYYDDFINSSYPISLDYASKIGDFIGGVVGVLFALVGILLLFETLALQRKELEESRKVFEKQQFENTFFSMLNLYKDIVNAMHFEEIHSSEKYYGKEFFVKQKQICFSNYQPTDSFYKNRKIASDTYLSFYLKYKEFTAHYFRTLYRIFKIIDITNFEEKTKQYYAKIIRAQLSESELFFINYNATIKFGAKFRRYILKYELLKHLPILERLEFKNFIVNLSLEKRNSISFLLEEIKDYIKSSIIDNNPKDFYKTYLKGYFAIKAKSLSDEIDITIHRKIDISFDNFVQDGYGLSDLKNDEIESLFKCFLIEVFNFSNYGLVNDSNSFTVKTSSEIISSTKSIILITLKTKNSNPIIIL